MEQSRVGSSHSPQGGSAPVRGKTMAKPSDEAAQEAAGQGGFLALMAALEQSPEADVLDVPHEVDFFETHGSYASRRTDVQAATARTSTVSQENPEWVIYFHRIHFDTGSH